MEARRTTNTEPTPPPLPSANLARNKMPPTRQLSLGEIQERRKNGLIFIVTRVLHQVIDVKNYFSSKEYF